MAAERGKMLAEDEKCIQTHIMDIEVELDAKDITGTLFSKNVIDLKDMQHIESGTTRADRTKRFLDILMFRGTNSFQVFLYALDTMGYKGLVRKLRATKESNSLTSALHRRQTETQLSREFTDLSKRMETIMAALDRQTHRIDEMSESKNLYATKEEVEGLRLDLATKEELQTFRKEILASMADITATLSNIKEMSLMNDDNLGTIQSLKEQVRKKDELLEIARCQISDLQTKVSVLEEENRSLKTTIEQQQGDITNLEAVVQEEIQERRTAEARYRRHRDKDREKHARDIADIERRRQEDMHQLERKMEEDRKRQERERREDRQQIEKELKENLENQLKTIREESQVSNGRAQTAGTGVYGVKKPIHRRKAWN
ncbi:golgin subfamily A member 6-like protein 6 [Haliotis rubra]|uniref:golgin subfamily A member 6-like protein 6 n=1 Tax=Haliotis rubra TaxID=36100 RepID=UPI001EE54808|nr:golgin subfamily A member 6-like protein 6 [Haliotis rubra]XP_046571123.1 golgin subfamily A member 6-like protein 6 [Haliotis rubra]